MNVSGSNNVSVYNNTIVDTWGYVSMGLGGVLRYDMYRNGESNAK